jgi:hypothetical protein
VSAADFDWWHGPIAGPLADAVIYAATAAEYPITPLPERHTAIQWGEEWLELAARAVGTAVAVATT